MKEQILKHLNILLNEYQKEQVQLEVELSKNIKEIERLDKNSDLIEISSKAGEVKECISWVANNIIDTNITALKKVDYVGKIQLTNGVELVGNFQFNKWKNNWRHIESKTEFKMNSILLKSKD